jgi:16S rRNA (guanine527-N7)-methyltransferase
MTEVAIARLREHLSVSRETVERLETLVALVAKWTPTINLVAKSTVADIWTRHVLDSAQIWRFRPKSPQNWADLGSGGGFPGLVIAAFAAQDAPDMVMSLIESDTRKTVFLQTAAREMGLPTQILRCRIEAVEVAPQDVISARAGISRQIARLGRAFAGAWRSLFLRQGCRGRKRIDPGPCLLAY